MDIEKITHSSDRLEQTDKIPLILAVEDNEDNQLLLEHTLVMFGWRCIIAADAIATLTLAKERQPDLILLDIVLPEIDGLQIALMLKSHQQTQDIPLIAVTGLTKKQDRESIFAAGFDDYIGKPFMLEELQQAIASNLQAIPCCEITRSSFKNTLLFW